VGVVGAVALTAVVAISLSRQPATVHNLVIAVITALGLILPYRTFFFYASAERSTRAS
jgi:hypothetical protein